MTTDAAQVTTGAAHAMTHAAQAGSDVAPVSVTVAPEAAELAVVIVNYNTRGFLERCLASLERHRGDIALDVLVIDNASRDGTHTARWPRIRGLG